MVIPQNLLEISGMLKKLDLVSLIRKNSLKSSQKNSLHSSNNSHRLKYGKILYISKVRHRLSNSLYSSKNNNRLMVIPKNLLEISTKSKKMSLKSFLHD
jgi:hypothetical protein